MAARPIAAAAIAAAGAFEAPQPFAAARRPS
jgi:hypothetical protein